MDEVESELPPTSAEGALPISPSLVPSLGPAEFPVPRNEIDRRVVLLCGIAAALVAQVLLRLIHGITNLASRERSRCSG